MLLLMFAGPNADALTFSYGGDASTTYGGDSAWTYGGDDHGFTYPTST